MTDTSNWHCDICNISYDITSKRKHLSSFKHILKKNSKLSESNEVEDVIFGRKKAEKVINPLPEVELENVVKQTDIFSLDDLRNDKFVSPPPPEVKKVKPEVKEVKELELKEVKVKRSKRIFKDDDDDISLLSMNKEIFDDKGKGTVLFGKENLELLNKINNYKKLFPKELGKFKVKKKATTQELYDIIEEMQTIINIQGVDVFIMDTILVTIKGIEGFSSRTRFNITGLSMMLKANPQFHHLAKQLYLKYATFSMVPPELQMVILIFTTGYICIQKNSQMDKMNDFLNQPVQAPVNNIIG